MIRPSFHRHPPEAAFAWASAVGPVPVTESLRPGEAVGRVLAADLVAETGVPAADLAATDGYALRAADTHGASDYNPLPLRLADGDASQAGSARPVCAGDVMPAGSDAVLPLDLAERLSGRIEVCGTLAVGDGVVAASAELRAGQTLFHAGVPLRPQDAAFLAMAGIDSLAARCRPRVAVLLAGRAPHEADAALLRGLLARDGALAVAVREVRDAGEFPDALNTSPANLVLVVGGTGFGENDWAAAALADHGVIAVDGLAMHPGETLVLGRVGDTPVALLPGAPLACLFAYDYVVARAVRRLSGLRDEQPHAVRTLPLTRKVASTIGRVEFCRVRLRDGQAEPLATAEGHLLASAVRADGFVVIPPESEGHAAGARVDVRLYD